MATDAAAITPSCSLAPVRVVIEGRCVWCGGALPKRARRWCSQAHAQLFLDNHDWNAARFAALERSTVVVGWSRYGYPSDRWIYCDGCGLRCNRQRPHDPVRPWVDRTIPGTRPEVNHVEPRAGAGYEKGCWNHQTNLQVLCHTCHVEETTRQLRERAEARRLEQPGPVQPTLWRIP